MMSNSTHNKNTDTPVSGAKLSGLETAAVLVLKQAVEMDQGKRYLEALTCYREGIGILLDALRGVPDDARKTAMRQRAQDYMERAEKLKLRIEREKQAGNYREQYKIAENSTGHSYFKVFRSLIDDEVSHIDIEDPYIRLQHQLLNLLRFCELVVKLAPNIKSISLTTGKDEDSSTRRLQESAFTDISTSLKSRNIHFEVHYSSSLHDREIRLNNGWIVKIGRGLDYFKAVNRFNIGYCDYDLRPCQETVVDIFHKSRTKQS